MATGTELFNNLDARSKNISNALDELNSVITGDVGFDRTTIWPTTDVTVTTHVETTIPTAFTGYTVVDGVENAIDTLFEGLPVGNAIMSASDEVKKFMQKVNTEVNGVLETAGLNDRIQAFKDLNNDATSDRTAAPYGYVPALLGVINAAANTNLDSKPVSDALNAVEGALNDVDSYRVFATYVAESTALLLKSLAVGDKTANDR
ncbi:MAG: hypothetical protein AAF674_06730 [Pseudomonadota bacterium]